MPASFLIIGPAVPESPVLLSVPHAGRDYPAALRQSLRAPFASLRTLEDRHVDAIATGARDRETMLLQTTPRAWIDLNRAEHERDPMIDSGASGGPLSAKVRAGLGIVPRRTAAAGDLWRRRLDAVEVEARIASDHRPYHAALADLLSQARQRFGVAILLDIHSMPPIAGSRTRIVIGDRFGHAAAGRLVHRVEAEVEAFGIVCALNTPYAGGHILERHARPQSNIHAIQLEIDRSLYLDRQLDQPGPGMPLVTRLLRRIVDVLTEEALRDAIPPELAAE